MIDLCNIMHKYTNVNIIIHNDGNYIAGNINVTDYNVGWGQIAQSDKGVKTL